MSRYPVGFWRVPRPQVAQGNYFSVIEDRGALHKAVADSQSNYLFAESQRDASTLATLPLAVIGTEAEITAFLIANKDRKISNRIALLPDIYVGISRYRVRERFRGLFPLQNFGTALFTQLVKFVPGIAGLSVPVLVDSAGIPNELRTLSDAIGVLVEKTSADSDVQFMKISYLPEDGMSKVATGEISLAGLLDALHVGGAMVR